MKTPGGRSKVHDRLSNIERREVATQVSRVREPFLKHLKKILLEPLVQDDLVQFINFFIKFSRVTYILVAQNNMMRPTTDLSQNLYNRYLFSSMGVTII